ncbi:NAD(P)/FAD-dependent oxidoreductase [Shimia marina]|uniref:Gamma-glutamylputrescine oxidoreductase n=1 Tax=Shimia marina TaxID=321267 RepID=A0A0P1ELQ9_9RHOB|nr:FAD-dependent oxidoreductase [Shimia marina]CUH51377.1 Gamma-glutamylputrescine oxidoreductase [Shimia marina]SFD50654.1 Glycine/D-amino acid oxidase [Shimia marina]
MTRICDPFSYGEGPIKEGFWGETVSVSPRISLVGHHTAEVAIIGAGVTGLNAALRLAECGVNVTVLDAQRVGWGASGRNGGFCCLGGAKASYESLKRKFGAPAVQDFLRAERAAVDHVSDLIARFGWQVDRHSDGETLLAHNPRVAATFPQVAEDLANTFQLPIEVTAKEDLAAQGFGSGFHGALTITIGFALNPLKYVTHLAEAAEDFGATIFENSAVLETKHRDGCWHLTTPEGEVSAKHLVIASNGYSSEHIPPWMAGRYLPAQSSVLVTRPLTQEEQRAQGWTSAQMAYDSRNLLHYFRLMPDGRFLFGMRGGLATSQRAHDAIRPVIRRDFEKLFPAWADVQTPHFWGGYVCYSRSLTPFAGPVRGAENLYAAFAYHGNGVAVGSYAGAMLAEQILQQKQLVHPEIMLSQPGRFPLGRFRRLLMYPAYLYYALKDL